MADTPNRQKREALTPSAVKMIRDEDVTNAASMERTASVDMRKEREDLKAAAEQSLNIILDLGLDGIIRWVSPSWQDVVGTTPDSVKGKSIADLLLSSKDGFANAVESMKKDDSKSRIIRFRLQMGPLSVLKGSAPEKIEDATDENTQGEQAQAAEEEQVINLEGQGIMVYDRSSGNDSHTMWMLRPSTPPREVTIDLPELLVESLGTGAEFLAQYLTELAEAGANDLQNHPPPLPVMCRICERQITPWWFEKHTEGCTQEYRAESEVTLAQEGLTEHRPAIVKVLDALDPETRQGRPVSGELSFPIVPTAEYKGLPIGPSKSSPLSSGSGKGTPTGTPPHSRDSSLSGTGHSRTKSFAVRRPLSKIVTLLVDLCDTALDIGVPAIKALEDENGTFRSQSPQSESRISQVQNWQTPSVATSEQEQGLSALITDTENLAQAKVDAVLRHREILEYTERIRVEFNTLVLDCIDAAIKKASSIKAGDLSSSSDEEEDESQEEQQEMVVEEDNAVSSYDGSPAMVSSMTSALRDASDPSMGGSERRNSYVPASSTRSSSPAECPTPRSHRNTLSFLGRSDSVNKRSSMFLGSDAGDSDNGMSHSAVIGHRRVESPSSDVNLVRSASSGERKRRSLRLPNLPSPGRNPSPARGPPPPASPLRIPKPRLPIGLDSMPGLPSPVTSPPLSSTEHSSPIPTGLRHRRQSSAASSVADLSKPPSSPRLNSISQPPARAVPTSIKDFEIIKPISKGAFGSVYLSKKKSTGDYFAIKCLRKGDMVAKNQVTNVKAERAIMMWQGESDFVAKLYWTFASKDFLFLVMEYLNGGDCASLVKVLGGLPEDWAKKYLAEVVLGVEHLHSRGIVHRDLKPDNLLIDQRGHLKLTDFGLSRMGLIGRQKRALTSPNDSAPDLFKYGGFTRTASIGSSRSASFDFQAGGGHSPQSTPVMTPDLAGSLGQPSYFNLSRDNAQTKRHSRRESGYRSDSGNSDSFNAMFRNFSLNEETSQRGEPIVEETPEDYVEGSYSPDSYALKPIASNQSAMSFQGEREATPPQSSIMPPPPMALFDPDDQNRRFVGTPDYLAPETINGLGQDEMSDWWSMGCILFEFLYGYPPFHGETPDIVFENILTRKIDWPEKGCAEVSEEAKDLMDRLMTIDPKKRLGSNMAETFLTAGDEIRAHTWFNGINWKTLLEDEAQFIPNPENPEDTEYFDARGATLQTFTEEMEGQEPSPITTPGTDNYDRPHDALSRVRSQVNSMKRGLMPLHIPPHVRDNRSRRLSEPVANDDFGNFAFKNLPVLEKANKEVIQKMRVEAQQKTIRGGAASQPTSAVPVTPCLEGSPLLAGPLKRTLSANKGPNRPASPSNLTHTNPSPNRASQPSSPLVSFSTGQNHERRKTSSTSSVLSHQSSNSLQPGSFVEPPKMASGFSMTSATSAASSPIKTNRHSANMSIAASEKPTMMSSRPHSMHIPTSRARSQTVGSADGDIVPALPAVNPKRHSQVFDVSPSSSDNEDRAQALLRVQRRRQSSKSVSKIILTDGPTFRPLDILICEDHPVSRIVMEKLFEKLKCRTIAVTNGPEAARYAMSQVQFDIILMEFKLPQINGADVARMIRDTKSANTQTPIVAVTGYLKELPQTHHFDSLIEKPPTIEKLTEVLSSLCQWRPPPPGYVAPKTVSQTQTNTRSGLRQESRQPKDESPSSQSSGPFSHVPGLYNPTSREHSIGSSFFGDTDSANTEDSGKAEIPIIIGRQSDDWAPNNGLGITEDPASTSAFFDKNFVHPGLPHLIHQNSAPSVMADSRTPRKQRSVEAVKAKREDLLKKRHECAESGDDEDEELGDVQVRARSPLGKSKNKAAASKLGTEMMRTNSRGSVSSSGGRDEVGAATTPSVTSAPSPPERPAVEHMPVVEDVIHPPEIFPAGSKGDAEAFVDMDATPKPPASAAIASIEQATEQRSPSPVKRA